MDQLNSLHSAHVRRMFKYSKCVSKNANTVYSMQITHSAILCCRYFADGSCPFGEVCTQAHSNEELAEWKQRFEQQKQQQQSDSEATAAGRLQQRLATANNRESVVSA